jgi:hypothetical protein
MNDQVANNYSTWYIYFEIDEYNIVFNEMQIERAIEVE